MDGLAGTDCIQWMRNPAWKTIYDEDIDTDIHPDDYGHALILSGTFSGFTWALTAGTNSGRTLWCLALGRVMEVEISKEAVGSMAIHAKDVLAHVS